MDNILKRWREIYHLSPDEAAEAIGITADEVCAFESSPDSLTDEKRKKVYIAVVFPFRRDK